MLSNRLLAYLNTFETLAEQPTNRWDGFTASLNEEKNFALRYQIAFACYALGALCLHPDADTSEQERCLNTMALLIDRMMQRRVWAYYAIKAELEGLSTDPIRKDNIEYSGHLAMMIGWFEMAGGDSRYDEPFTLLWSSTEQFVYTHTTLVETMWQQMHDSPHRGVNSITGHTHIIHMNQALWALALYDALHGSTYAAINDEWIAFLQRKMVLRGPYLPGRGVFSALYLKRMNMPMNASLNLADAWTLAMLAPLYPELAQQLMPRFQRCVRRQQGTMPPPPPPPLPPAPTDEERDQEAPPPLPPTPHPPATPVEHACIPSASRWQTEQISDETLTTGFGHLLAVHMDDHALAEAMVHYADSHFAPVEEDGARWYRGGTVSSYTTALLALGEAGGLHTLRDALSMPRAFRPASTPPPDEAKAFDTVHIDAEEIERMNQAIFAGMDRVPTFPPRDRPAAPAQDSGSAGEDSVTEDTTATGAVTEPDTPDTPTPARFYELQIQITLPVAQFPTEDDLHTRHQLEDGIEERGAGAILDVSTRMGMMEVFVETQRPEESEATIRALLDEFGIADKSSVTRR